MLANLCLVIAQFPSKVEGEPGGIRSVAAISVVPIINVVPICPEGANLFNFPD